MEILRVCVWGGGANKCNRAYWGTLKHKKANFHFFFFLGGGGNKLIFISGEQGNRYPRPTGGLHTVNYWKSTNNLLI